MVVGTCADGYGSETNDFGDVIYTNQGINEKDLQYFWESFPVGKVKHGEKSTTKTTYMFTYLDADSRRPTIESIFDDYFTLLPTYQPTLKSVEDLDILRSLCAFFPTYKASPLQIDSDRVLLVGDASGIQSPLSFGGFGATTRHLSR